MASTLSPPLALSLTCRVVRASSLPILSKRENHGIRIRLPSLALASATAGIALATVALTPDAVAAAASFPVALSALQEPPNALSLPTWAIHVSSVVEWYVHVLSSLNSGQNCKFYLQVIINHTKNKIHSPKRYIT
jgi:Protein of unknown function (DUF2499)